MKDEVKKERLRPPWLISLTHDLPSSLVLSLPLENRYPRGFSVYPAASQPAVFALAGYPVYLADSQLCSILVRPGDDGQRRGGPATSELILTSSCR